MPSLTNAWGYVKDSRASSKLIFPKDPISPSPPLPAHSQTFKPPNSTQAQTKVFSQNTPRSPTKPKSKPSALKIPSFCLFSGLFSGVWSKKRRRRNDEKDEKRRDKNSSFRVSEEAGLDVLVVQALKERKRGGENC